MTNRLGRYSRAEVRKDESVALALTNIIVGGITAAIALLLLMVDVLKLKGVSSIRREAMWSVTAVPILRSGRPFCCRSGLA